ncbi:MAG: HD domain-containing protein [Bacteriovoracia bacterium]
MGTSEFNALVQNSTRLQRALELVEKEFLSNAGHDISHLKRVAIWSAKILAEEKEISSLSDFQKISPELFDATFCAAFFHDWVNLPKDSPDRKNASLLSSVKVKPILADLKFSSDLIESISAAVRTHSFSRGEEPIDLIGRAVQDADRLEALGAIGIMRVFQVGQSLGTEAFCPEDPWAKVRSLNDKKFCIDHFFVKLFKLPETMKTRAGKKEAIFRTKILDEFLSSLGHELGMPRSR